jgi:4-amino-4-deoxychorismate lyase
MTEFIESLRLENGKVFHLELHQRRLNLTTLAHYGAGIRLDLEAELKRAPLPQTGLHKIRVTYGRTVESVEIEPYTRRVVERIALIDAHAFDYRFKYADRSELNVVRAGLSPGTEPLIVQHGLVTDAVYANVCFFDGVRWITPERPLLEGVARAVALVSGEIHAATIAADDVRNGKYNKLKLINCMTLFAEAHEVSPEGEI